MNRKLTHALAFIMVLAFGISKAQLSGSYTIGGVSPNYATITDAVNDLNSQGISAPVVFNIRDGIYAEKMVLTAVAGATFTNTITFQSESGDSTLVTITALAANVSGGNYTISMTGADYFNFHQLTIQRTGALTYAHVIELAGGCDYNNFTNCVITNAPTPSVSINCAVVVSAAGITDNYNVFMNNRIENGSFGFYFWGSPTLPYEDGNMIMNNRIVNQSNYGIQAGYESEFMIAGNYITTDTASGYGDAVSITNFTGNAMVMENKIELPNGGLGIYLQQCNGGAANEVMVYNNFVSIGSASTNAQAFGIKISDCSNTGIYFNNVNNTATGIMLANNYAFSVIGTGTNVTVLNNAFISNAGYVVGINNNVASMNYNDLFKTAAGNFASNNTTTYANFAAWKTATNFDSNSVNINPQYVSVSDLHVQTYGLNGRAVPIPNILTDIDGDVRDLIVPDIGADETYPPSIDAGVTKLLKPIPGSCGSNFMTVTAIVRNYAALPQTNVNLIAEVTGTQTATLTGVIAGPISVAGTDTVYFTPTLNTANGDSLIIKLYASDPNDEDHTNDTLLVDSIYINSIPASPSVPASVSICPGASATVNATFGANQQVYWFNTIAGGIPVHTGNPLTVSPAVTTTYYAEVRDTTVAGTGCLRITEVELNDVSSGGGDYIEIQNLSAGVIDATGWVVGASNSYTDANLVNGTFWNLGPFNPGETQIRYDANTGPTYWGTNLLFTSGQPGWVIIVDATGVVMDFVAWGWTDTDIQNMNITINGFPITIGSNWSGNGAVSCASGTSVSRTGSSDNDDANDWACETETENLTNTNLALVFSGCGSGGCPSDRVPVVVNVTVPAVYLGNDTTIAAPNTITLDAGAGFASYIWSNGSTTQTIVVSVSGTYVVTVTDSNGCTGSDIILVIVVTGINDFGANSEVVLSPVPAKDYLKVSLKNMTADNYTITLINNIGQRIITSDVNVRSDNSENIFNLNRVQKGVYFVEVKSDKGIYRQRVLIQ